MAVHNLVALARHKEGKDIASGRVDEEVDASEFPLVDRKAACRLAGAEEEGNASGTHEDARKTRKGDEEEGEHRVRHVHYADDPSPSPSVHLRQLETQLPSHHPHRVHQEHWQSTSYYSSKSALTSSHQQWWWGYDARSECLEWEWK